MAFVAALPAVVGGIGSLASAGTLIGGPIASVLGTGALGSGSQEHLDHWVRVVD